jgi:uncharacterized repeat protein (TIGR01451 family)
MFRKMLFFVIFLLFALWTGRIAPAQEYDFFLYHPSFMKSYYGWNSMVYLQNTNDAIANFNVTFGSPSVSIDGTIPPFGTWVIDPDTIPELPPYTYTTLVVSSDQPLSGVLKSANATANNSDNIVASRLLSSATTSEYLLPASTDPYQSSLHIWNTSLVDTNITITIYGQDGTTVLTQDTWISPGEKAYIYIPDLPGLTSGDYGLQITSEQPVVNLMYVYMDSSLNAAQPNLPVGNPTYLPRAFNAVDEGGGTRTTILFIGNLGLVNTTGVVTFINSDATVAAEVPFVLPPAGFLTLPVDSVPDLMTGETYGVSISSDQPMAVSEISPINSSSSTSAYSSEAGPTLELPRLVKSGNNYSFISLQNLGETPADVTVDFYSMSGDLVATYGFTDLTGFTRFNLNDIALLGNSFEASAIVNSTESLMAYVDEYLVSAPELTISKTGPNSVPAGNPITYTLTVSNTGNLLAEDLVISDTLPIGAFYVSGGNLSDNTVTWTAPVLDVGASLQFQFVVTATQTVTNSLYSVADNLGHRADGDDAVVTHVTSSYLPVSDLTLTRSPAGDLLAGSLVLFTATVNPISATLPITYVWQASEQAPVIHISGLTDNITYTWELFGTKGITVTASNIVGSTQASEVVQVTLPEKKIFIPIIMQTAQSSPEAMYWRRQEPI